MNAGRSESSSELESAFIRDEEGGGGRIVKMPFPFPRLPPVQEIASSCLASPPPSTLYTIMHLRRAKRIGLEGDLPSNFSLGNRLEFDWVAG